MGFPNFFRWRKKPKPSPGLKEIFQGFQAVLAANNQTLALMGDLEEQLAGRKAVSLRTLRLTVNSLDSCLTAMVSALQKMSGGRWPELETIQNRIKEALAQRLAFRPPVPPSPWIVRLEEAAPELLVALGGKAANLARLFRDLGLPIPPGVVATTSAYRMFMSQNLPDQADTLEGGVKKRLARVNFDDPVEVDRLVGICASQRSGSATHVFHQVFSQYIHNATATG